MLRSILCSVSIIFLLAHNAPAEELPPGVLATVDGHPITEEEVDQYLAMVYREKEIPLHKRARERRVALQHFIIRHLALEEMKAQEMLASDADVDLAQRRLEADLEQRGSTLDDYLQSRRMTLEFWRIEKKRSISWERYVEKHRTEEELKTFFESHRREFDGTRLKVAHIFFKVPDDFEFHAVQEVVAKANNVRGRIVPGDLSFARAAERFSEAPTAKEGGELGWIGRREPMPERFAAAAFALKEGELSEPVVTLSGVHLIVVHSEEAGTGTFDEARKEVELAWEEARWSKLLAERRKAANIVYRDEVAE